MFLVHNTPNMIMAMESCCIFAYSPSWPISEIDGIFVLFNLKSDDMAIFTISKQMY